MSSSGGAGSGYIGNTLISNKKMVGYNVPTSDAESTKTESISEYSDNPVSGKPKGGDGYAKIRLIREPVIKTIEQIAKNVDFANHYKLSNVSVISAPMPNVLSDLISYYGTDWNLQAKSQTNDTYVYQNGVFKTVDANNEHWQYIVIPLDSTYTVCGIKLDIKQGERRSDGNGLQFFCGKYTQGNTPYFTDAEDGFMCIAKLPCHWGSASTRFFTEIPANYNDWQTVEASILNPVTGVNYIAFCTWASPIEVKNIKLTVL